MTREQHAPYYCPQVDQQFVKAYIQMVTYSFNTNKPLLTHAEKTVCGW